MNNIGMYVINAVLVLMVIRQIREHPLDLRSLAGPVLAVGAAAVLFLHSVPMGGNDAVLELACVAAGATMGAVAGLTTKLRRGSDGRALGRAGWLAASLWITGVGARPPPAGLTSREAEVLTLLAAGLSNAEIAQRLFLSNHTVKTHINRIFAKTGARDRAQAVRFAYQHGLAAPAP
jgi:DNA-binding NarL/FixJ family response regulator